MYWHFLMYLFVSSVKRVYGKRKKKASFVGSAAITQNYRFFLFVRYDGHSLRSRHKANIAYCSVLQKLNRLVCLFPTFSCTTFPSFPISLYRPLAYSFCYILFSPLFHFPSVGFSLLYKMSGHDIYYNNNHNIILISLFSGTFVA